MIGIYSYACICSRLTLYRRQRDPAVLGKERVAVLHHRSVQRGLWSQSHHRQQWHRKQLTPRSFQSEKSSFSARGSSTAPDNVWAPDNMCVHMTMSIQQHCTHTLTYLRCLLHQTYTDLLPTLQSQLPQSDGSRQSRWASPHYHHITLITLPTHVHVCWKRE